MFLVKANKYQQVTEVDDIKLRGATDTLKGRAVIQRDFERLEKWANMNAFQFNEGKCKVLHLGYNKPIQQPGADWVKGSFAEKVLGVPANNKDGLE